VLGHEDDEIARLGVQHGAWRSAMLDVCRRAGIGAGSRAIDVGAGPGFATVDLAGLVGDAGTVLAVERSTRFVDVLRDRIGAARLTNVRVQTADLARDPIDASNFDAAWCRWVACFVPSPARLVRAIHGALRPGGVAVFHEYVDYAAWRCLPARPAFEAFVAQVMASWRADGGEPDVARALPSLLRVEGFRVVRAAPLVFALRPVDEMWRWPAGFVRSGSTRLRALGRVGDAWVRDVVDAIDEAERDAATLMITPMVLEIVATRI
jgi:SAM-dependent methyltransferase